MGIEIVILLRLISAHFVADFIFQPKELVERKRKGEKRRHLYLVGHALIHILVAYFFICDWQLWLIPLIIGATHYLIDLWKSSQEDRLRYFIIDQALHLFVIVAICLSFTRQWGITFDTITSVLNTTKFWSYLIGFIIILKPTSILLKLIIAKWNVKLEIQGLRDAGAWIGCTERFLVLTFMCLEVYEAIGFLLAAKSIFRFGELKEAKHIKTTEYIMIGTFLSFTIAIIVGLMIR